MQRRDIPAALLGTASAGAGFASGRSRAGDQQPAPVSRAPSEVAANVIPLHFDFPVGDLRRYGGDPSGASDSSNALQSAANTGNVVIPAGCTFKILKGANRSGPLCMTGSGESSRLLSDSTVITVTGGTGSYIDNFQMVNITDPWLIFRDSSNWAADVSKTLSRSSEEGGYQPTINDGDLWPSLTKEQQNQQIGPGITMRGNAHDITISRISGRFVVIAVYDAQYSCVSDCSIRGGKGATAAIVFWNISGQEGLFNKALRNTVRLSSFSGIAFARNSDFQAQGNFVVYGGESGVKTWQGIVGGKDSKCYRGQIQNNSCKYNLYDGVDAMSEISNDDILSYHQIQNNCCHANGGTGINSNGQFNQITDNYLSLNGRFGLWGAGLSLSKISGNFCVDNNQSRKTNQHDLNIDGKKGGNTISDNWVWAGAGQNNYGIYAPGSNFSSGNVSANGSKFLIGANNGGESGQIRK